MTPSAVQIDVLRRLAAADLHAHAGQSRCALVRRAGGFWCVSDSLDDVLTPRAWTRGEFSVGIQTVRAMEKRGYLARVGRVGQSADMFDDPRVITDLGRQVATQVATKITKENL